jgi:pimeloyl-ACP methyl ester carboxylesterase
MASDVQALTRGLGFERFHLLGHSMGGAIVQEMALEAPERLLSLTLFATTDGFGNGLMNPVIVAWRDWRFSVAEEQGMAAVSRMNAPFPPPPHMPAERLEETNIRLSQMTVDAFIGAWNGLSAWQGTHERARNIGLPTLVIWGDMDSPFIIEGAARLVQTIPGAEAAVIPECGHSARAAAAVQRGAGGVPGAVSAGRRQRSTGSVRLNVSPGSCRAGRAVADGWGPIPHLTVCRLGSASGWRR